MTEMNAMTEAEKAEISLRWLISTEIANQFTSGSKIRDMILAEAGGTSPDVLNNAFWEMEGMLYGFYSRACNEAEKHVKSIGGSPSGVSIDAIIKEYADHLNQDVLASPLLSLTKDLIQFQTACGITASLECEEMGQLRKYMRAGASPACAKILLDQPKDDEMVKQALRRTDPYDNKFVVMLCNPKGQPQRRQVYRVLTGRILVAGEQVTLTRNTLPFQAKQFMVISVLDGIPHVKPVAAKKPVKAMK